MGTKGLDKDQTELPKSVATGDSSLIDNLRMQKYNNKDEIHIHDDANGLVFKYTGKRAFQLGMDTFIKMQHLYAVGQQCIVKGTGQADLVLERTSQRWKMKVVKKDSVVGVLLCDQVIIAIDEFIQRI